MDINRPENIKVVHLKIKDINALLWMQKKIYSKKFAEKPEYLKKLIISNNFNIGVVINEKLVGFLLTTKDYMTHENEIFLYDIGVLPEYQKKGLGSLLIKYFFQMAYEKKLKIYVCCRDSSYPMFSKKEKIEKMGYKIVKYQFEKNGYFKSCGVHEDTHEIYFEPIE